MAPRSSRCATKTATPHDALPDSRVRPFLKTALKPRAPHHSVASSHSASVTRQCSCTLTTCAVWSSLGTPIGGPFVAEGLPRVHVHGDDLQVVLGHRVNCPLAWSPCELPPLVTVFLESSFLWSGGGGDGHPPVPGGFLPFVLLVVVALLVSAVVEVVDGAFVPLVDVHVGRLRLLGAVLRLVELGWRRRTSWCGPLSLAF